MTRRCVCLSSRELARREIVEARMRPYFVVVPSPTLDDDLCFGTRAEPFEAEALVAEFAVEAFRDAILPRLARLDQRGADAGATIHDSSAFDTNSGPLSLRRKAGAPRSLTRRARTSITRGERMRLATSIASPSLVNSSVTVRHLSCWPLAQRSNTKS